ncbi:MAG: gas vesicle protein GvpD P-loop domain-containing protein, partial [Promethearchaeota archaeon]
MTKTKVDNIPIDVYESLNQREIGFSLLIKGAAGTGKTTLALSLLSIISDAIPIYISTRVAPQSLYVQFPWIQEILNEENILD